MHERRGVKQASGVIAATSRDMAAHNVTLRTAVPWIRSAKSTTRRAYVRMKSTGISSIGWP